MENTLYLLVVDRRSRANGKTDDDMDWASKLEEDGFIAANGPVAQRVAMVAGKAKRRLQSTKGHGPAAYKMVTARKVTLMEVI